MNNQIDFNFIVAVSADALPSTPYVRGLILFSCADVSLPDSSPRHEVYLFPALSQILRTFSELARNAALVRTIEPEGASYKWIIYREKKRGREYVVVAMGKKSLKVLWKRALGLVHERVTEFLDRQRKGLSADSEGHGMVTNLERILLRWPDAEGPEGRSTRA